MFFIQFLTLFSIFSISQSCHKDSYAYRFELDEEIEDLFPRILSGGQEISLGDSLNKAHSFLSTFSYENYSIMDPPRCRQGLQLDLQFPSTVADRHTRLKEHPGRVGLSLFSPTCVSATDYHAIPAFTKIRKASFHYDLLTPTTQFCPVTEELMNTPELQTILFGDAFAASTSASFFINLSWLVEKPSLLKDLRKAAEEAKDSTRHTAKATLLERLITEIEDEAFSVNIELRYLIKNRSLAQSRAALRVLVDSVVDICDRVLTKTFEKSELSAMTSIYEIINRTELLEMTVKGMDIISKILFEL